SQHPAIIKTPYFSGALFHYYSVAKGYLAISGHGYPAISLYCHYGSCVQGISTPSPKASLKLAGGYAGTRSASAAGKHGCRSGLWRCWYGPAIPAPPEDPPPPLRGG